jgi:predicted Fe-S protein YdhL (DUF1289 family)
MTGLLTKNPCIDDCSFKKGVCKGCGRTSREKKGWKHLDKQEKHAIWLRILATHAKADKKKGRQLLERYEKAQRQAARKAGASDEAAPPQTIADTD